MLAQVIAQAVDGAFEARADIVDRQEEAMCHQKRFVLAAIAVPGAVSATGRITNASAIALNFEGKLREIGKVRQQSVAIANNQHP